MTAPSSRVAIIGSDLLIAALPAEPVQVMHASMALGFDFAVPASWGDEVVAGGVLDDLAHRPPGTTILCSCPAARKRLLASGTELTPYMLQFVPPPVAAARYLRLLHGDTPLHITYFGSCQGTADDAIDDQLSPAAFLELCAAEGIALGEQPRVFDSFLPADRRRYLSLPGGLPAPEPLRKVRRSPDVVTLQSATLATDLVQCLFSGRNVLIDMSGAVGCACTGHGVRSDLGNPREVLRALEPPRSPGPVVDTTLHVVLDLPGAEPSSPTFEETVPLSVVADADLTVPPHADGEPVHDLADSPSPIDRAGSPVTPMDFEWSDSYPVAERAPVFAVPSPDTQDFSGLADSGSEPDQTDIGGGVESFSDSRSGAEPSPPGDTAPSRITPSGQVTRAYLMHRRLRGVSGNHPALPGSAAQDANFGVEGTAASKLAAGITGAGPTHGQQPDEGGAAAATTPTRGSAGAADAVSAP